MWIEQAIGQYLQAEFAIPTWGSIVPDKTSPPYCVYDVVSTTEQHTHDGPSTLVRCRMQFAHFGATKEQAKSSARQLRFLLNGHRGLTYGLRIWWVLWDNERDLYGPNTTMYQVVQDYIMFYEDYEEEEE